ncbi:MAG: hypothetical protein ACJ76I_15015 [Gaiellaceae bacterium]
MIAGATSLAALATVVAYVSATGGRLATLGWALGLLALAVLLAGLALRWPRTIVWSVAFAGSGYVIGRVGTARVDGWAAVIGTLLLASAEFASWSIGDDVRIHAERALVKRRLATLGVLIAAALLVSFVLLGTSGVAAQAGVLLAAAGVAAALAAIAVVLRLARA